MEWPNDDAPALDFRRPGKVGHRQNAEALRGAEQNQIARSLEQMEQSGGSSPAAERAAEGIAELTREIEGAAERVLGEDVTDLEELLGVGDAGAPEFAGDASHDGGKT